MTTRLEAFRDHCARMSTAEHKPECPSLPANIPYWHTWSPFSEDGERITGLRWNGPPPPAPICDGCLTDADRALFARLAADVDEYQQLTLEDA